MQRLPDLDQSAVEIYESADPEPEPPTLHPDATDSEEIVSGISSSLVIQKQRQLAQNRNATETTAERLRRIARELNEIQQEKESFDVKNLRLVLEKLQTRPALVNLDLENATQHGQNDDKSSTREPSDTAISIKEYASMEQRISELEHRLGVDALAGEQVEPVLPLVKDVSQKLKIIASSQELLEKATADLSAATSVNNVGLSDENKKQQQLRQEQYNKMVSHLYERLPEIDILRCKVPLLIERLRCLQKLHVEVTETTSRAKGLIDVVDKIESSLDTWETTLNGVESKIAELEANRMKNKEEINKWRESL